MDPAPISPVSPNQDEQKKDTSLSIEMQKANLSDLNSKDKINFEKPINYFKNNIPQDNKVKINISDQTRQGKDLPVVESEKEVESNFHFVFNLYLDMRNKFMLKVYGILFFQLLFTFGFVLICQLKKIKDFLLEQKELFIVLMSAGLLIYIIIFIIFICKPGILKKVPHNYICILIVTICMTIFLVYLSILYPPHFVIGAMSFVLIITLAVIFISLFNKIDIKYLAMALLLLASCAFDYGLLAIIYRSYYLHFLYCLIGGILYTLFIAFDTISIRDHYSIDDYIFAALTLYLDIVRLFIQILKILGSISNKR